MRVLWFVNIQLPAVTHRPASGGGWMEGLRRALQQHRPDIELGIASFGAAGYAPFIEGNATYFNILLPQAQHPVQRVIKRWRHDTQFPGALESCMRVVGMFQPDMIHIHGTENLFGLICERTNIPTVISLQGVIEACLRFHFRGLTWQEVVDQCVSLDSIKGGGVVHDYLRISKEAQRERRIFRLCSHFIGRTTWDREILWGLNPVGIYYHCDEVMSTEYYQAEWRSNQAESDLIYCTSGGAARKGVGCLIDALAILKRNRPMVKLRLAGNLEQTPYGSMLRKRVARNDLDGTVEFLGQLRPGQIVAELLRASVYVTPSHIENSPNSLCEAMLVGVPCVASYVGGVPSLLRDGEEGLLYHDSDPYALAGKLNRILEDRNLAACMGATARVRAQQRHDPQTISERTAEIYHTLIQHTAHTEAQNSSWE